MAKKINLSGVKEFMFHHGEKVALGICAFLALVFGGLGLMRAMSAGTADGTANAWDKELKAKHDDIRRRIASAEMPAVDPATKERLKEESYFFNTITSIHSQSPYNSFPTDDDPKRLNPIALSINKNLIQLNYVAGLVWLHEKEGANLRTLLPAEGGGPGPGVQPKGPGGGPPPFGGAGQGGGGTTYLRAASAQRLVVVTAVFPMKEQMEEFQKKMKMLSQSAMLSDDPKDLPTPVGINVTRYEVVAGKPVEKSAKIILQWDSDKTRVTKAKALDNLLQMAFYDEEQPAALKYWLHEGFHTPMPRLANAKYPKFSFKGSVEVVWNEEEKQPGDMVGGPPGVGGPPPQFKGGPPPGGGLPGVGGKDKGPPGGGNNTSAALPERKPGSISKKKLEKQDLALHDRLFLNKYNVYHILGLYAPQGGAVENKGFDKAPPMAEGKKDIAAAGDYFSPWRLALPLEPADDEKGDDVGPKGGGIVRPKGGKEGLPMGGGPPPGDGQGFGMAPVKNWDRDAIIRFVDPDVMPGKAYQYKISVVLKNPNFEKKDKVTHARLAEEEFLAASDPVLTPMILIPEEHFLYCLDQRQLDEFGQYQFDPDGKKYKLDAKGKREYYDAKKDPFLLKPGEIAFQIHEWTETASENNKTLYIGDWAIAERIKVRRGDEIGAKALVQVPAWYSLKDAFEVPQHPEETGKKKESTMKPGLWMSFKGEKRKSEHPVLADFAGGKHFKSKEVPFDEETAVDALLISPDGKLSVLNSRIDSDETVGFRAKERHDRVTEMRLRVKEINNRNDPAMEEKKGGPGPKGIGGKAG